MKKKWDKRTNFTNPNWDTPSKMEARSCSVIEPYRLLTGNRCLPADTQYWTMGGAHFKGEGENVEAIPGELGQVTSGGLIDVSQWRGVDRDAVTTERNQKFYPEAWWAEGDFYETMQTACARGEFNPGLVNYDGVMGPKYGIPYLVDILWLIDYNVRGPMVLVANFVLKNPYRANLTCDPKTVLPVLLKEEYTVPDHWSIVPMLWNYHGGASVHSSARMGTFVFVKSVHNGKPCYTRGRNILLEMPA